MRALIVEAGHTLAALATVRALGSAGWEIGVGSPRRTGFASASRFTQYWHRIPAPVQGIDDFVKAINSAVAAKRYDIVFCTGDAELLALAYSKDKIDAIVPYPAYDTVKRALDKLDLAVTAEKIGLGTPRTVEATNDAIMNCEWPVVIKAQFHWLPEVAAKPARLEAEIPTSRSDAIRRANEIRSFGGVPLVQELVPGQLMGYTAVTNTDHVVVARLQQIAPVTWRPNRGMPARAHTVPIDLDLAKRVEDLLSELSWFGLVQLQFILSPSGKPKVIDFNGRPYASLALAAESGVNFVDIWGRIASGEIIEPTIEAEPGVRYHWLEGDLKRLLVQSPARLIQELPGCYRYASGSVGALWSPGDIGPSTCLPRYWLTKLKVLK